MYEIKRKYEKMMTMVKVAMAKPGSNQQQNIEKLANLQEKRQKEEAEVYEENKKDKEARISEIKTQYNQKSGDIKIDFSALIEALKRPS